MLEPLLELAKAWGAVSALATALVYLAGYLVLRSHMAAWGIEVERSVLDLRYLFSGASFLMFAFLNIAWWAAMLLLLAAATATVPALRSWFAAFEIGQWMAIAGAIVSLYAFFVLYSAPVMSLRSLFLKEEVDRVRFFGANPARRLYARVLGGRSATLHARILHVGAALPLVVWALYTPSGSDVVSMLVQASLLIAAGGQILLLPVHYGILYYEAERPVLALKPENGGGRALLLFRGEKRLALLRITKDGAFRIHDVPLTRLDTAEQVGVRRLGRLLLGKVEL